MSDEKAPVAQCFGNVGLRLSRRSLADTCTGRNDTSNITPITSMEYGTSLETQNHIYCLGEMTNPIQGSYFLCAQPMRGNVTL